MNSSGTPLSSWSAQRLPAETSVSSWLNFYASVTHQELQVELAPYCDVLEQITNVHKTMDGMTTEKDMQTKLPQLLHLPTLGITVEGTRNAVHAFSNDPEAVSSFHNATYSRGGDKPFRPDLSVRYSCMNDRYVGPGEGGLENLGPSNDRLMHFNIISVIDLKPKENDDGTAYRLGCTNDLLQARECAENLLRADFRRDVAFCALTNFTQTVFVGVTHVGGTFSAFYSQVPPESDDPSGISYLAAFLATQPDRFFRAGTIPFPLSTAAIRLLGRGGTSSAIAVVTGGVDGLACLKTSRVKTDLEIEEFTLNYLRNIGAYNGNDCSIPRISPIQDQALVRFSEGCEYCKLMTPVYDKLPPEDFSIDVMHALWNTLRKVHSLGIVHCDLRTPNVGWYTAGNYPAIFDWGSARFHVHRQSVRAELVDQYDIQRQVSPIVGLITSSDAVLRAAAEANSSVPKDFAFYPADDAVAFIKMCLQSRFLHKSIHAAPQAAGNVLVNWRDVYKYIPTVVAILDAINVNRTSLVGDGLNVLVVNAIDIIGRLAQVDPRRSRRREPTCSMKAIRK